MKPKNVKKNRLLESRRRIEMNSAVKRGEMPKPTNSRNCKVIVILVVCIISTILIYSKIFEKSPAELGVVFSDKVLKELVTDSVEEISEVYNNIMGSKEQASSSGSSTTSSSSSSGSSSSSTAATRKSKLRSSKNAGKSAEPKVSPETNLQELQLLLLDFYGRIDETLKWIIKNFAANTEKYGHLDKKSKQMLPFYNSFTHFSNIEIHLLHKIRAYLKEVLQKDVEFTNQTERAVTEEASLKSMYTFMKDGYQCKPVQASQQEVISKYISADICSEIEWYKLAQLAWPGATNIVDVGANKGYLGSLFLSLWGGGGLGISPSIMYETSERLKSWKGSRNPAGYCKDGFNAGVQLHCPSPHTRDSKTGICNMLNPAVRVASFDGSGYLANTINSFLKKEIPKPSINVDGKKQELQFTALWQYNHNAASDAPGKVNFTKQDATHNAGFEGGSIISHGSEGKKELEEVVVTTIDNYLAGR